MSKVIDFYKRKENLFMKKEDILVNLNMLKPGDKVNVYSEVKDMFNNDHVEKYIISKEEDGLYIIYNKKTGFEQEEEIKFKEKVKVIGANCFDVDKYKNMKLTKSEMKMLKNNRIEKGLIKRGFNLVGTYENGLEFDFENVIMVSR